MNFIRHVLPVGVALGLALGVAACGGDPSGSTSTPTVVATPSAMPRSPVVLDGDNGGLPALTVLMRPFATTETGSLEATVDWTYGTNDIDVYLARGSCTFEQFVQEQCTIVASATSSTAKPERARLANQPAGTYTFLAANFGPDDESIAYQVVFTPGTSAASAAAADSTRAPKARRLRRGAIAVD
jgi:hypothetical protein